MNPTIIIKYSELALKKGNRSLFERQLAKNISKAVNIPFNNIDRKMGRFYLNPNESEKPHVLKNLARVFGIHAFTKAIRIEFDIEEIKNLASMLIIDAGSIKTFGVRTKRSNKNIPFNSYEISQKIGGHILENHPNLKVNLRNPDVMIHIEVRDEGTFVYSSLDETQGPGGFPVNTSGRGLLLLSGGIDSPVAGWCVMKRGMTVDGVYFDSSPYTSEKAKEKVLDLARVLARWKGGPVRVLIPSLTEVQRVIAKHAPEQYWTILIRRSMMRIATNIAKRDSYQALITGENLAQVASQTLENLSTVGNATDLLTLRPLIANDKNDTVNLAKKIGTFEISIRPFEDCCTLFTPKKPRTKSKIGPLLKIEQELNLERLEEDAAAKALIHLIHF